MYVCVCLVECGFHEHISISQKLTNDKNDHIRVKITIVKQLYGQVFILETAVLDIFTF